MKTTVIETFHAFSAPLEGEVAWMYCDILGLVTVGVGNLIDPVSEALKLPFYTDKGAGRAATPAEITQAWNTIKSNAAKLSHSRLAVSEAMTTLRLRPEGIEGLVRKRLAQNGAFFAKTFTAFEAWPADAQLASMSMCWAMGPGFAARWPMFTQSLKNKDFAQAATHCEINVVDKKTGARNEGVVPRNKINKKLFENAALVAASGASGDTFREDPVQLLRAILSGKPPAPAPTRPATKIA